MIELYWIRHLPVKNPGIYIGQTDVPAIIPPAPADLEFPENATFYTSPLLRAVQTAKWLGRTDYNIAPELMEQNFGIWEGRSYDEVWREAETAYDWSRPETIKPDGGESFIDVCNRVDAWIDTITREVSNPLVVIAHAGVIRSAYRNFKNMTVAEALTLNFAYGSVTKTTSVTSA